MRRMLPTNRRATALLATSLVALSVLTVSIRVGGKAKSPNPRPLWQVAAGVQDVIWTNLIDDFRSGLF
jgi:hypothetical protein